MGFKDIAALFAAGVVMWSSMLMAGAGAAAAEPIRIVALGDSLMAAYGLEKKEGFPARLEAALKARGHEVTIIDAGVSGDTTSGGLSRLDWSVPDGTDGVILELGANDALRGIAPETTRANLEAMITRLEERDIPVLLAGIYAPPNMGEAYEKKFNPIYPDLAEAHDLLLYPFFLDGVTTHRDRLLADGMHPNAAGIEVMVERFVPIAEQFLNRLATQESDAK